MMDDLLKGILSSAGSQPSGGQAAGDPLADLLGGLMGGGGTPGAGEAADPLQALLGGGTGGAGDLSGILGAVMGGGGAEAGASAFLAPVANGIAEKLGLPPEIAQLIVTFVIGKLMSGTTGQAAPGAASTTSRKRRSSKRKKQPQSQGLDLADLLGRMGSGAGLDAAYLQSTGMPDELAQQTGLDPETATRGLQEALQMLGGQMGGAPPRRDFGG
jgi:hypothetical protein